MDYFELLKAKHGLQVSDAYTALLGKKLKGGGYPVTEITGELPFSFLSRGASISDWTLYGNTVQNGTPTPDAPIDVHGVGKLVGTDWTIPISSAGQTVTVNLGQTQTVRRIRKLVFDGTEAWSYREQESGGGIVKFFYIVLAQTFGITLSTLLNTHGFSMQEVSQNTSTIIRLLAVSDSMGTVEELKSYLAQQYAAGTPVTAWYILASEETGIVNEPLMKIRDYADELRSTDAGVEIPTVAGVNTLTTDTTVHGDARIKGRIQEI